MATKRVRRKCNCCGTWKNVTVILGVCYCYSCISVVCIRTNLYEKLNGKLPNMNILFKELKIEIEQAREGLTCSWS